jgi:hypothetical protein
MRTASHEYDSRLSRFCHTPEIELSRTSTPPLAYVFMECTGYSVAQLVEALRYKPEGRGFDSRWCHWNFSLT